MRPEWRKVKFSHKLAWENRKPVPPLIATGRIEIQVIPAHCSGWRAVSAPERAHGAAVVPAAVGRMFPPEAA